MCRLPLAICLVTLFVQVEPAAADESSLRDRLRVFKAGERPQDARLGKPRDLNDAYHPWVPAADAEIWKQQSQRIREQVLVATGLWPLPEKAPLEPVIHGRIDRGDYTVEKVYFASLPGHYVTGSLYRPKNGESKHPGVLCPHGHWANGRFYDAGEAGARQQIAAGAETHEAGARYPLQARMVQLARMGCVVFHYDMIGYADSTALPHREGFGDAAAGLRLQNWLGLQTWNSIRALDFLTSLDDVDAERIGVTGASGGGTQTFILGAIDERPTVAFPAVMVSTAMQGGCVCENADYLRLGINNVAIAALFAPRPMAMSGADDWTIDIETKGLPELKQVYSLFEKPDHVAAKCYPQFKHNYNQVAREMMSAWFNEHLRLGQEEPIRERDFDPLTQAELTVFDEQHPRPDDEKTVEPLREQMTKASEQWFRGLLPRDASGLDAYRRIVGTAARVMLGDGVPPRGQVETRAVTWQADGVQVTLGTLTRRGSGEQIPFVALMPEKFTGTAVVWLDGAGKSHVVGEDGRFAAPVRRLLDAGRMVVSADLFLTGEYLTEGREAKLAVNGTYPGYTFGYNRPLPSQRARDVLTTIGAAAQLEGVKTVQLVGMGAVGPCVLLALAVAGDAVERTIADLGGFHFGKVESGDDPMYLPGALKYGGIGGLAALASPSTLIVAGTAEIPETELAPLATVYRAVGAPLDVRGGPIPADAVSELLLEQAKE